MKTSLASRKGGPGSPGRTIFLEKLTIVPTYLGMLLGGPDISYCHISQHRNPSHPEAFIFLSDEFPGFGTPGPEPDGPEWGVTATTPDRFPWFLLVGELASDPLEKGALMSVLTVVVPKDVIPENPVASYMHALGDLRWETKAQDFDF